MLVDDDFPVIELLTKTIDWDNLGFIVQSTHGNGKSALEKAEEDFPDVLISDIGMPKMNGIELTRKLKEMNGNLQVVLLSCHTDFSYAQQALKLQINDYLVKDTFEIDELCDLLKKCKKELDILHENKQKEQKLEFMIDKNRDKEKDKIIYKLLNGSLHNELEWENEKKKYEVFLEECGYIITQLSIHPHENLMDKVSEDVSHFAISNIISEILGKLNPNAIHFMGPMRKIYIFFPADMGYQNNAMLNAQESLKNIQNAISNVLNINSSSIIGDKAKTVLEYQNSIKKLANNHHQLFYMLPNTVEMNNQFLDAKDDLFSMYDQAATEIRKFVMGCNKIQMKEFMSYWLKHIYKNQYAPEAVKDWILKLLLDLKVKLQALQYFSPDNSLETKHQEIFSMEHMYQIQEWLVEYFENLISQSTGSYNQKKRKEVIDAFRYVNMHLERKITLDEIASHLYLNPSYFSRLFKKEVGETFVEYVTRMKIARAKELLEQTDESVGKISERLGYDNQSYFIKIFKTYAGTTPIEYRSGKVG